MQGKYASVEEFKAALDKKDKISKAEVRAFMNQVMEESRQEMRRVIRKMDQKYPELFNRNKY